MSNQKLLAEERKEFKENLTIYRKMNGISQRAMCAGLGILENEFHNMLTGFQSSIPAKHITGWEDFMQKTEAFQKRAEAIIGKLDIKGGQFSKAYLSGCRTLEEIRVYCKK